MYTWFNDANNVQKLLAWKRERDGKSSTTCHSLHRLFPFLALRRSRPSMPVPISNDHNGEQESGNTDSNERNDSTTTTTTNRPKRRSLFTDNQRRILKQIFENEPYPSQSTLEQLVDELALPMTKIANWFHNSRMRAKNHINPTSISTSLLNHQDTPSDADDDDDGDLDDNNNNNHNLDEEEDEDDVDEDDYPILPTIVPLTR